jgi:hypothetical protein
VLIVAIVGGVGSNALAGVPAGKFNCKGEIPPAPTNVETPPSAAKTVSDFILIGPRLLILTPAPPSKLSKPVVLKFIATCESILIIVLLIILINPSAVICIRGPGVPIYIDPIKLLQNTLISFKELIKLILPNCSSGVGEDGNIGDMAKGAYVPLD